MTFYAKPLVPNPKTGPHDPYFIQIDPVECSLLEKYRSGRLVQYRATTVQGEVIKLHHTHGQTLYRKLSDTQRVDNTK